MMHYNRLRRHGDPLTKNKPGSMRGRVRTKSREDRFWEKVDKDGPVPESRPDLGPCWVWTAARFQNNYGAFREWPKQRRAHVVSFEMTNGPLTQDKPFVLHHCDNPPCVRPSHLFAGTIADNMWDMRQKGREGVTNDPKTGRFSKRE